MCRKAEQPLLIVAEDGALQEGGERQVVFRLQRYARNRHQILHSDVVGQHQTVGTGHRNAAFFQFPRQGMDESVAFSHQNHHVSGLDLARPAKQHLARGKPVANRVGNLHGKPNCRSRCVIDRLRPVFRLLDDGRTERWPDLDMAGRAGADRQMLDRLRIAGETVAVGFRRKHQIDRRQDVIGRAERARQLDVFELPFGAVHAFLKLATAATEGFRLGSLERIDRLLFVAHRKHGTADTVTRAKSGEELRGQGLHHRPLVGTGILGFIEQNVIDPLVQLVLNPRAGVLARQQSNGAGDQIVEIEETARALEPLITPDEPVGDGERRFGAGEHRQKADPIAGRFNFPRETLELVGEFGEIFTYTLGHDPTGGFWRPLPGFPGEKRTAQGV